MEKPIPDTYRECLYSNYECSELMLNNYEKYKEIALKWTKEYAI